MEALRSFAQEAGERIAGLQVFCLPLALICFLSYWDWVLLWPDRAQGLLHREEEQKE